jgi:anti-sigma28 factor (negative regulator of flagellin synthesis)
MGLRSREATCLTTLTGQAKSNVKSRPARDERLVREAMTTMDMERETYINQLKRDVRSGLYDPSAEEIAEAMISERLSDR